MINKWSKNFSRKAASQVGGGFSWARIPCDTTIDLKIAAVRHVEFPEVGIFNGGHGPEGQYAAPCQIWSTLVKSLQRWQFVDLFNMAAVRHLAFIKRSLGAPINSSCVS